MIKLILRNYQCPGDILMLTAALRDLHLCCPGKYATDVRTSCPDLWLNNPFVTRLDESEPDIHIVKCHYPLVHQSNQLPYHFVHGFSRFLSSKLEERIEPRAFRGDIHLDEEEKQLPSHLAEAVDVDEPFWIIVAGGKMDFTVKWWDPTRYQKVISHFRDKIRFVQVGEEGHHHPPLKGVVDLRGKTTLRDLVRLMYHAQGVLCPVTFVMHLAAAVPTREGASPGRACVVVAGGRESPHWEAYPGHQFIHTIGALPCCATGGCWRSRAVPLPDNDKKNRPAHLCKDVAGNLPRCMDMITAEEVIRRIALYFDGRALSYLT